MCRKNNFFLGALIGFVVALLFAPKKGKEVREDILDGAKDMINDPQGFKENMKQKLNNVIDKIKNKEDEILEEEIIISRKFDE